MTPTNTNTPRHHYSSLLKTLAFAFAAMAGFSTLAQAEPHHLSSIVWEEIDTPNNVSNPLSIAVSPVTHDFVALGSNNEEDTSGSYYFLDHNNLTAGWQKRGTFEAPCYAGRVIYGADRFIVTFIKYEDKVYQDGLGNTLVNWWDDNRILTSIDNGSTWGQNKAYSSDFKQEQKVTFINVGSDASDSTCFALKDASGKKDFVAIGNKNFFAKENLPRGPHGIVAFAGDDENGWIALASDGRSYFGLSLPKCLKPQKDSGVIAPEKH